MSTFQSKDGFFQSNYNDPNIPIEQSYAGQEGYNNYYGQQYHQEQQMGYETYPSQPSMLVPEQHYAYTGQTIMQPSLGPIDSQNNLSQSGYSESFDDEPPLLEELGINFDHIYKKTFAVLNPFTVTDAQIINETDLAGPLCFCLALGATLLLGGKVSFGYIYGIGGLGVVAVYMLLNMMSATGVTLGCVASVIGYCILPMVILSTLSVIFSLKGLVGILMTVITVTWCSLSASKLFVCGFSMDSQQLLIAYPCALLYGVFALLTIF